jgi:antitoxin CcdA
MRHEVIGRKRATNVSLPEDLVTEARALGVNVSSACTKGLAADVKKAREDKWIAEHKAHFEAWNRWVEENGLPLADLRQH